MSDPVTPPADSATESGFDFKRVLPIFVIVLVDLMGLTLIIPLLPLYTTAFGANALTIGLIAAAYPTMQLLASPILGNLSDRFGRKPVLIVSQIGTFIGFIVLGFANALPLLLISRVIDGISGANIVTAQAAITDSTTEENRAQGMGLIGAAFGIGFVIGPAISGVALAMTGNDYRVPAFLAAGFSLLSIFLTTFWFKETLSEENRQRRKQQKQASLPTRIYSALTNPLLAILMLLIFLNQLVFGGFEQLLPLFTLSRVGLDGTGNAMLFVFMGIVLVMVQGRYIGPLSRKFGEQNLIYAGLALLAVGLIMASFTPEVPVNWYDREALVSSFENTASISSETAVEHGVNVPLPDDGNNGWLGIVWIYIAMIPATIGGTIVTPSINSLITKRTDPSETGSTLGVSSSLYSLANAMTPLLGGAVFQFLGVSAPFMIGGVILLIALALALQYLPRSGERQALNLGAADLQVAPDD
ncbi:MAG: MFS transporter [Chloroflexota bacterium]